MNNDFWLSAWQRGGIGFHHNTANLFLKKFFPSLEIKPDGRILVPLCGKTKDMMWLKQQGFFVTGIELSPIPCRDFFIENNLPFFIKTQKNFTYYKSDKIEIYCGDFFDFTTIQTFQVIYDCAALVAFPFDERRRYAKHIIQLSEKNTIMLLFVIETDNESTQSPFSVCQQEVQELYQQYFKIELIERFIIKKKFRYLCKKKVTIKLYIVSTN